MCEFEWDASKAKANKLKHGVEFADAVIVFEDYNALTMESHSEDEERFVTIGMDALLRVLVVVYTYRADTIRIISARKATKIERQQYADEG